jgi:hypothetical protein
VIKVALEPDLVGQRFNTVGCGIEFVGHRLTLAVQALYLRHGVDVQTLWC